MNLDMYLGVDGNMDLGMDLDMNLMDLDLYMDLDI